MAQTMTVTPKENVDFNVKAVIDNDVIFTKEVNSDEIIQVYNEVSGKFESIRAIDVSLYDHRPIFEGTQHVILHMLTK